MKNIIIIVLVLIITVVAGWGFYKGYRIKTNAKAIKALVEQSNSQWTYDQIKIKGYNSKAEMEAELKNVYDDSKEQLVKLNTLKSTSKTYDLEQKTQTYFSTAILAADKAGVMLSTNSFLDVISTPIVNDEEENILTTYPNQIKNEAGTLAKTVFSF